MGTHFHAPWGLKLWVATTGFLAIMAFVAWRGGPLAIYGVAAVVLVALTFMVRGYSVVDGKLLVHRLGWATTFNLDELTLVEFSPGATMGSVRVFGIGGFFGFIGRFRNQTLGLYSAYCTDSDHTVVLDLGGRKVVVTPDDPSAFVAAVEASHP